MTSRECKLQTDNIAEILLVAVRRLLGPPRATRIFDHVLCACARVSVSA